MKGFLSLRMASWFVGALVLLSSQASWAMTARYFRVWQGFKKPGMSDQDFRARLPEFMSATVTLYHGRGLDNYLVAVPPAGHPAFIPDEFALVAFDSEKSYQAVRATPAGQAYGEKHWEIFDKQVSKSTPFLAYAEPLPSTLVPNTSYDVIGTPIDWAGGYTVFYLGLRKPEISAEQFLRDLAVHVGFVAGKLTPLGLKGYIIIANPDYEVAYMNWSSKRAMDFAFTQEAGKSVSADGAKILNRLMFQGATKPGTTVPPGSFFTTEKPGQLTM